MNRNLPTFRLVLTVCFALLLSACSSKPDLEEGTAEPTVAMPTDLADNDLDYQISDPFEGFNRRMYYFNAKADEYVLLPVVEGYQAVTPDFVETGISNFFSNIGEIPTFINSVLQFKLGVAAETLGRFAVNSTIGVAGLFDVATPVGLDKQHEDFGQTLGLWGVDSGAYLVLPFLGPSSVRDAIGSGVDLVAMTAIINEMGMKDEEELLLNLLRSVDARANVPFRYYESGSAFEYEKVRLLYLKYREIQVAR